MGTRQHLVEAAQNAGVYGRLFLGALRTAGKIPWKWITDEPFDMALWTTNRDLAAPSTDRVLAWVKDTGPDRWHGAPRADFMAGYYLVEWDTPAPAAVANSPLLPPGEGGGHQRASVGPPDEGLRPWQSPAFQQWLKDVAALPAEKQVEAVSKKLMELNPGFDGKMNSQDGKHPPIIDKGVVTELSLVGNQVVDISPVRALAGLKTLSFPVTAKGKGRRFSDLSQLAGMKLASLNCTRTEVADLSPLRGMPITRLTCTSTQISDLSPLAGAPLLALFCNGAPVSDLSPLESCKGLEKLAVKSTKVTPASVAALQKALTDCKIEWDAPAKAPSP